jgi:hypothetical protein
VQIGAFRASSYGPADSRVVTRKGKGITSADFVRISTSHAILFPNKAIYITRKQCDSISAHSARGIEIKPKP